MKIIKDPVKLAQKLVSIPSESGNEKAVGEYIFEYLNALGLNVFKQKITKDRFNVIVVGKGDVLFCNHIDTVPVGNGWKYDPYGVVKNGRLYGRGGCDTKGSGACLLAALAETPNKNVNCSFTVGEENTFIGIKNVMKLRKTKLNHVKNCVNLEPTNLRAVIAHKGRVVLKINTAGKAAHASVPGEGKNAIVALNKAISSLLNFSQKFEKISHKVLGKPTLNIGVIKGGTASNIVPDYAEIDVDIRILPGQKVKSLISDLEKALAPAKVRVIQIHEPVDLKPNLKLSPFQKTFAEILKKNGLNHQTIGVNYTTEFSEMAGHGIGGLVFGAGGINECHIIDEFTSVDELKQATKVLKDLLEVL